ncbi:MAG: hypothetical protein JSR66_26485 [Proteobacteria bacterium]|nr:hypothetical protein [Pseudomonadota bacterium]
MALPLGLGRQSHSDVGPHDSKLECSRSGVFPLILAAYVPGRIKSVMKHSMLAAVMFWAVAHLLANGTLAAVLLFGAFL